MVSTTKTKASTIAEGIKGKEEDDLAKRYAEASGGNSIDDFPHLCEFLAGYDPDADRENIDLYDAMADHYKELIHDDEAMKAVKVARGARGLAQAES